MKSEPDVSDDSPRLAVGQAARSGRLPIGIVGALIVVLTFGVYMRTLAPGLTWAHDGVDGGDIATAVANWGIAHPPGYPAYILIARALTWLPIGDLAYRLNVMSAAMATLAILGIYLILLRILSRSKPSPPLRWHVVAGASASLMLAFSPVFWSQALITEVYALNALFVAVLILLSLPHADRRLSAHGPLALGAFVFGLGLGIHVTTVFLLPLLILRFLRTIQHTERARYGFVWLVTVTAFLLGLAVYAYLPLRAGADPVPNWGDPETTDRFLWVVTGAAYRQYVFGLPLAHVPARVASWAGQLLAQYGLLGVVLGLLGMSYAFEKERAWVLATSVSALLYSVYAVGYDTTDSYVYLIPAYMIFALWIGHGVLGLREYLERYVARRRERALHRESRSFAVKWLLIVLLLALPTVSLASNFSRLDLRGDDGAAVYGSAAMTQAPPQAMIISSSDAHTFALWYAQQVSHQRADVIILDRDLLQYEWYARNLRKQHPDLIVPSATGDTDAHLAAVIDAAVGTRPVYLADAGIVGSVDHDVKPEGVLYRVLES